MPIEAPVYALAFAVLLQAGLGGFFIGRLTQRVKGLEDDGAGHGGLALQFAEFRGEVRAEMRSQTNNITGLREDLTWLRQTAAYEPEHMRGVVTPRGAK